MTTTNDLDLMAPAVSGEGTALDEARRQLRLSETQALELAAHVRTAYWRRDAVRLADAISDLVTELGDLDAQRARVALLEADDAGATS